MPQPQSTQLHISTPLTNISVAYQQRQPFIADVVFPLVPVQKQYDQYFKYTKSDWFRSVSEPRAPGTESAGTGWNVTTGTYGAKVYAVHKDIDDQTRANADNQFNLDRDATEIVTNDLLIGREKNWVAKYFAASVGWTDFSGNTNATAPGSATFNQFNSTAEDVIVTIQTLAQDMQKKTGIAPNTLVVTPDVHLVLLNTPDIIDRIKYTSPGFLSNDLIAAALGVQRYLVAYATNQTANEPSTSDAGFAHIAGTDKALLCYSAPAPGLMVPSAGYTFAWTGFAGATAYGSRVKRFRMEHIESDRIEGDMAYDQSIVSPDLGYMLANVLV